MSKKQVFEVVLLALSVMLVVAKTIDEMGKVPQLSDDTGQDI